MDKKGTLQSRLRKICAEIDGIKNEEKKELSKIIMSIFLVNPN